MCFLFDWLIVKKRGVPLHEKQQMDDDNYIPNQHLYLLTKTILNSAMVFRIWWDENS